MPVKLSRVRIEGLFENKCTTRTKCIVYLQTQCLSCRLEGASHVGCPVSILQNSLTLGRVSQEGMGAGIAGEAVAGTAAVGARTVEMVDAE